MPFRRATGDDVPIIARMLRGFYAKSGGIYDIPWDHDSAINTVNDVVRRGICVVGSDCCAGAMLSPFPYNSRAILGSVVFWHFKRPRDIQIFDALVGCCKLAGATHINPSSHFPINTIGRFYEKRGLIPVETQFLGAVDILILIANSLKKDT
jgi:hypothetical protein